MIMMMRTQMMMIQMMMIQMMMMTQMMMIQTMMIRMMMRKITSSSCLFSSSFTLQTSITVPAYLLTIISIWISMMRTIIIIIIRISIIIPAHHHKHLDQHDANHHQDFDHHIRKQHDRNYHDYHQYHQHHHENSGVRYTRLWSPSLEFGSSRLTSPWEASSFITMVSLSDHNQYHNDQHCDAYNMYHHDRYYEHNLGVNHDRQYFFVMQGFHD